MIITHVFGSARTEICTVGVLFISFICLTCVNFMCKHNGLVHPLRVTPVYSLLCNSMKYCSVMVRVWITRIVVLYAHLWNVVRPCLKYWLWKLHVCCWSPFDTVYHHKTRFGSCQGWNMQSLGFTNICCTSMKRGLALVKIWNETCCFLFVSVRYSVSS